MTAIWPWVALFGLGAFHGINPAMGWLFALCLGLQERRHTAVLAALPPIALGHALSVGLIIAVVAVLRVTVELSALKYSSAGILVVFGLYRLLRTRHPRWVGMRVGFRDLTLWSFLMASAHGAGLMLLPVFLAGSSHVYTSHHNIGHSTHFVVANGPAALTIAVVIHTFAHLLTAGAVALLFYHKLGLDILKTAWVNIDLAWAVVLVVTGGVLALI
jgi:hypothetical protein